MASEEKGVLEFRETVSVNLIIRRIKSDYYHLDALTGLFDKYPVFEVRNEILRYLLDRPIEVSPQNIDWIKQRIIDLKEEARGERWGSHLWEGLLTWYIFNTDTRYTVNNNTDLVSRALEFTIGITEGSIQRSNVLKIVAARLEGTPHIYPNLKTPSLKPFLESFLTQTYQSKYDIVDYEMVDIKRVIRCAIAVCDWGFLPHLEKVLAKVYQSQENRIKTRTYDYRKEVEILQTEALLKETIRLFKEKTEERVEDN